MFTVTVFYIVCTARWPNSYLLIYTNEDVDVATKNTVYHNFRISVRYLLQTKIRQRNVDDILHIGNWGGGLITLSILTQLYLLNRSIFFAPYVWINFLYLGLTVNITCPPRHIRTKLYKIIWIGILVYRPSSKLNLMVYNKTWCSATFIIGWFFLRIFVFSCRICLFFSVLCSFLSLCICFYVFCEI